jgi:hypothetical protein
MDYSPPDSGNPPRRAAVKQRDGRRHTFNRYLGSPLRDLAAAAFCMSTFVRKRALVFGMRNETKPGDHRQSRASQMVVRKWSANWPLFPPCSHIWQGKPSNFSMVRTRITSFTRRMSAVRARHRPRYISNDNETGPRQKTAARKASLRTCQGSRCHWQPLPMRPGTTARSNPMWQAALLG